MILRSVVACWIAITFACSPKVPPPVVPPQSDPTFDPLKAVLQAYVDQTQPYRKEAAQAAEKVPGKAAPTPNAEAALRTRQQELADALRAKVRPNARQGEIFTPQIAAPLKQKIAALFNGPQRDLVLDELAEQNTTPAKTSAPQVNAHVDAPRVPPRLREALPTLPTQLEYDFVDRTLVLRDVDAGIVVDFLPDALPVQPPAGIPAAPETPLTGGAVAPLPMPGLRGGRVFALVGDSGSGDVLQQQVAQAMLTYFTTARHFPFVLMLGDNLYHDDYTGEFLSPYKPLLDRGVKFYAALGNHDKDVEIHFKPFNMGDRDRYTFDEGNARFAALNSNHPADPEQIKWLDGVFHDAGDKWRICFFHHPLYSSGQHGKEAAQVIRPALEQALVRNGVHVVFSGHDHLYERTKPQPGGIVYFVSGGGGRYLYDFHQSAFDEVGLSEHHFMVAEVAGDRLFYEAISHAQKVLDCGVLLRAPSTKPDDDTRRFQGECDAAKARPRTTNQ
jgi:calcineurin-like phosphoesterase family protein